jgi:hypothetical protein
MPTEQEAAGEPTKKQRGIKLKGEQLTGAPSSKREAKVKPELGGSRDDGGNFGGAGL